MRVCYKNLLDAVDEVEDVSGENGNWPSTNVFNPILTTTWRTIEVATTQYITFDSGSTFTVDTVFVSGHNLQNTATIHFQMNDTNAWGAPSVDETLTWRSGHIYKFITSSTYRYIRFTFSDTTNPDDYIKIGRLWAGEYLQMNPTSMIPFKITNVRNDLINQTDQGAVYGTLGISRRIHSYEFPPTGDTMIESVRTMYDEIGTVKPIYFMNYNTDFDHIDILYGRITNPLEENIIGHEKTTYTLDIEEAT